MEIELNECLLTATQQQGKERLFVCYPKLKQESNLSMLKMWEDKNTTFQFVWITTHTLRVHIHCEGCTRKVKKILRKIEDVGVYEVQIEAEEHIVTVSGNVKCTTLIKKLAKSGKLAEIWPSSLTNQLKDEDYLKQMMQSMMNNNHNSYKSTNPIREDVDNWILANHVNNNEIENMQENSAVSGWQEHLTSDKSFMEGDKSWSGVNPGFGETARLKNYYMGMPTYEYYGQPSAMMNTMQQGPWDNGAYNTMLYDMQNMYSLSNVVANNYVHQPRMMTTMHQWERLPPITDQYRNNYA